MADNVEKTEDIPAENNVELEEPKTAEVEEPKEVEAEEPNIVETDETNHVQVEEPEQVEVESPLNVEEEKNQDLPKEPEVKVAKETDENPDEALLPVQLPSHFEIVDDVKSDESEASKKSAHEEIFQLQYEEEEEELSVEEEIEEEPFVRDSHYVSYVRSLNDYGYTKRLNNFLHKKMAEYFKKRKMEHVLVEGDHADEAYLKYTKKLKMFYGLIDLNKQQRMAITEEMKKLKQTRDEQLNTANEAFISMLEREKEIGTGLIMAKTGKEIPEKALEKMIHIQRDKALELQDLRLIHIKIGNGVQDKMVTLKSMDKIGDNYTLMEFEQLKMENEGHADKIEERDEELAKLRRKCNGAIQCLAHVREKCSAIETQIKNMRSTVEEKDKIRLQVREQVNNLKQERDYFRTETQNMKEQSGLLTKDKLLTDMEISLEQIEELEKELEITKNKFERRKAVINAIKKNYEKESRKPKYRINRIAKKGAEEREKPVLKTKERKCHIVHLEMKAVQSVNSIAK